MKDAWRLVIDRRSVPRAVDSLFDEQRGTTGMRVIFLHGVGASGRYWYAVADRLTDVDSRLYLVDLLGFGRSPKPDVLYRPTDHLAALDHWRSSAGLADEPFVLIGHSVGAIFAAQWALHAPVAGLILVGLPVYDDPVEVRRHLSELSAINRLTLGASPLGQAVCSVMCHTRPLWQLLAPYLAPGVPPQVARDAVQHTWTSLSGTLDHCIFGVGSEQRRLLTGIPVVLIHGTADRSAPIENVRQLVARSGGPRLVELAGGGHDLPLSHPDEIAREVRAIVTRVGDGERGSPPSKP